MKGYRKAMGILLALVMLFSVLPAERAEAASASGDAIVACAKKYIGKVPYVWGGTTIDGPKAGADCSGFVCRIYEKFGFDLWEHRTQLRKCGTNIGKDLNRAMTGDLVWFDGHIAIYAGKDAKGNHTIVHETGGDFENVVWTKTSVVKASLEGIIRIPGVKHTESGGTQEAYGTVTFSQPTDPAYRKKIEISDHNAVVCLKITKPAGCHVSKMGMVLYDGAGNTIKKYTENVKVGDDTGVYHSWYDIGKELGVSLKAGTEYQYRMFGIFDGREQKSGLYTFRTTGTRPPEPKPEPKPEPPAERVYCLNFHIADGVVEQVTVKENEPIGDRMPKPRPIEGQQFAGWEAQGTDGKRLPITERTSFTGEFRGEVPVYPRFVPEGPEVQSNTVTYIDTENGTQSVLMRDGDTFRNMPKAEYREGMVFAGWYTERNGGRKYENGDTFRGGRNLTLYPQYSPVQPAVQKYDVFFYDGDNGAYYGKLTVENEKTYSLLPAPKKQGFAFLGWYTERQGGSRLADSVTMHLTADTAVYAHWKKEEAGGGHSVSLMIDNPYISVDGSAYPIDSGGTTPVIRNGRTLLPVRAVIQAMGGTVEWQNSTRTAVMRKDGKMLTLQIGNHAAWDGQGRTYSLDTAPVILNGRTMLPIRFIAEYFGAEVTWYPKNQMVVIRY